MFPAKASVGGLSIPMLRTKALFWYTQNSYLLRAECDRLAVVKFKVTVVTKSSELNNGITLDLHKTLDGNGMSQHSVVPYVHSWVSDGSSMLSRRKYISAIQVQCNTLFTKGCAYRGQLSQDLKCEMCGDYESLGHKLQTRARTWKVRCNRHDSIAKKVCARLDS